MRGIRLFHCGLSVLLAACAAPDITSSDAVAPALDVPAAGAQVADVSGTWHWNTTEDVAFPAFLAALLGVAPEGDLTHGTCASSGTMELQQAGRSFEGAAVRTSNACTTRGGQPFNQPGVGLLINDGRVTGGAVHFDMDGTAGPCPHQAVITSVSNGVAGALSGRGKCRLPGHPQSESSIELPPPPQGYARTTSFEAVRP